MTDHFIPFAGPNPASPIAWSSVLKIWWLMTWRATLGSVATGAAIGVVVAIIGLILHWPPVTRTVVIFAIGTLVGLAWRVVAVRMALTKRYADFRLTISPLP